ncbi:tetratricopeptide repeat protein, partial [Thermodesulfobacteriota bacterium]
LYDPVKAVRTEAARRLAEEPANRVRPDQQKVFESALKEFEASMEYSADFAFGRYNLGNLYAGLNRQEEAVRNYKAAIKIDDLFYPAKVNLAMLYNRIDENEKAKALLHEVVDAYPEMYEIDYSLGLLLVEMKEYDQALVFLQKASDNMPERARVHYNFGLLLQFLKRDAEAEAALTKALKLDTDSMDYLYALADFYLKRGHFQKAKNIAEMLVAKHPEHRIGHELLEVARRNLQKEIP